jgi:phospholipase/carboxylesterase
MRERTIELAGWRAVVVEPSPAEWPLAILLHGYAMRPADLSPFAHSLGVRARFVLPEGPVAAPAGRAWWAIDEQGRAKALADGPRDLYDVSPPGLPLARAGCAALIAAAYAQWGQTPTVLAGFSQGGMLACDIALREPLSVAGLALLSSSCVTGLAWESLASRLAGVPVLVSHGRGDADLAFGAGERLRDLLRAGGAAVTWVPGDHGHTIPFAVWRALRGFVVACLARHAAPG